MNDRKSATPNDSRDMLLAAWNYASGQVQTRPLQLTGALTELRAWLDDPRQCRRAGVGHWRGQLSDVETTLAFLVTLAGANDQPALEGLREELKLARAQVRGPEGINDSLRARLRLLVGEIEVAVDSPTLLPSIWDAGLTISAASPQAAVLAVHAAVDLAQRRGPAIKEVTRRVLAALEGHRNAAAADCLLEAKAALLDDQSDTVDVVWVHIVEARLYDPPVLPIGDAILLVADSVFENDEIDERDLLKHAPELARGRASGAWLFPDVQTETEDEADEGSTRPRSVYARVRITPTPEAQAYVSACEQIDFVLGLAAIQSQTESIWHYTGSHWLVGTRVSWTSRTYDKAAAWKGAGSDEVARIAAQYAERLAPHFPLSDVRWETAGLLLSWLRKASQADAATQLILCDRVIEQVAGWAGFDGPQELVAGPVRTAWRLRAVLGLLGTTYIHLLNAEWPWPRTLAGRLVIDEPLPPHAAPSSYPTRSRVHVIALADELADEVPAGTAAAHHLRHLRTVLGSKRETQRLLEGHASAFDRRNTHLRRTRNALLHGGPIVPTAVEHVSSFAVTVANIALGDALEAMLDGEDVVSSLIASQRERQKRLDRLSAGTEWSAALFPDDA